MTDIHTSISNAITALEAAKVEADAWRANIDAHAQAVKDAETAFASAVAALKAKPTADTVSAKCVAEQILENAKTAFDEVRKEPHPAIRAEHVAKMRLGYAEARAVVDVYAAETDRDLAAIIEAESVIREAVARLNARAKKTIEAMKQLEGAGATLGLPVPQLTIVPDSYQARTVEALRVKYARTDAKPVHHFIRLGAA